MAAVAEPLLSLEYWWARANVSTVRRDAAAEFLAGEHVRAIAVATGDRLFIGDAHSFAANAFLHSSALSRALQEFGRAEDVYASIGARA